MAKEKVVDIVARVLEDILPGTGLELVDVEYVKEREWYLRVFLDKPGGIELEDCQRISEALGAKLDEMDPIKESYLLEVSSPGLDRPLKKERDFERNLGKKIDVHLYEPLPGSKEKILVGELAGFESERLNVRTPQGDMDIPADKIAQVRLHIEF